MAKVTGISAMGMDELNELLSQINDRKQELRAEFAKEIIRKIYIGAKIRFMVKTEEMVSNIKIITENYVGVEMEGSNKNRRIEFSDIIGLVE